MTVPVQRQRLRQVSAERIAKVAAAMHAKGVPCAVKLETDGSATLLTDSGALALGAGPEEEDAEGDWDRALGLQ